ncbi:MAG: hypothetical protein Q9220_005712 [cf. Caloplaca sp. 1 TL-2023]
MPALACSDCASGTLHHGNPVGRVETLHDLPTYISDPSPDVPPKGIIIMIPDAFGWEVPNNRLLCDTYAKRMGMTVYLPEFQDGCHLPMSLMKDIGTMTSEKESAVWKIPSTLRVIYHMAPYLYQTRFSLTFPRIQSFFAAVRASSSLPLFAAGFCWGGRHAVALTHGPSPSVTASFTAHPSGLSLPSDIEKAEAPLSICNGTKDFVLDVKGIETIRGVMAEKNRSLQQEREGGEERKGRFEIQIVEGARHGFAVRGDPGNEEEMKQAMVAEEQAVECFGRWAAGAAGGGGVGG